MYADYYTSTGVPKKTNHHMFQTYADGSGGHFMYASMLAVVFSGSCFALTITIQSLDTFHVYIDPRRSLLLETDPAIKPRTQDDWESEADLSQWSGLLSPLTPQQKASPVAHCALSQICACPVRCRYLL